MLYTGLLFGLLGSLHCIGMCGPIALALPNTQSSKGGLITGRIVYNLGRVFTYSLMGAAFGIFGQGLQLAGLQQTVSILSGVLILIFVLFPAKTSSRISSVLGLSLMVARLKKLLANFFKTKSIAGLGIIGVLNGLLPCGFVYLALAGTLSFNSLTDSILYMTLFGLGTLPLMLAVSVSGQLISFRFRNLMQKGIPYMACFIGLVFILRGLSLGIPFISPDLSPKKGEVVSCH